MFLHIYSKLWQYCIFYSHANKAIFDSEFEIRNEETRFKEKEMTPATEWDVDNCYETRQEEARWEENMKREEMRREERRQGGTRRERQDEEWRKRKRKRREAETKPEELRGEKKERTRAKIRQTHEEKNKRDEKNISQQQPHWQHACDNSHTHTHTHTRASDLTLIWLINITLSTLMKCHNYCEDECVCVCVCVCEDKRVDLPLLQEQISAQRNAAHYQPWVHLQHLADTRAHALALMNDRQSREIYARCFIHHTIRSHPSNTTTNTFMITASWSRINRGASVSETTTREETRREKK